MKEEDPMEWMVNEFGARKTKIGDFVYIPNKKTIGGSKVLIAYDSDGRWYIGTSPSGRPLCRGDVMALCNIFLRRFGMPSPETDSTGDMVIAEMVNGPHDGLVWFLPIEDDRLIVPGGFGSEDVLGNHLYVRRTDENGDIWPMPNGRYAYEWKTCVFPGLEK